MAATEPQALLSASVYRWPSVPVYTMSGQPAEPLITTAGVPRLMTVVPGGVAGSDQLPKSRSPHHTTFALSAATTVQLPVPSIATCGVPTKVLMLGMSVQTPAPPRVHWLSQTWPKLSRATRMDWLPEEAPLTVTRLAGNGAQDQPV